MIKKYLDYITLFCLSLGISLLTLSFLNADFLKANLKIEDLKKIEQSKFIENFKIETYTDLVETSKKVTAECSKNKKTPDRIIDYFEQKTADENACIISSKENLERLKSEKEIEQIIKEYKMLDSSFQRINANLEEILKQSKKTVKERRNYTS